MKQLLLSLLVASVSILCSCSDDETTSADPERTNSEAAGDVIATIIGQETGGAGIIAQDASNLAEGFSFGNGSYKKQQILTVVDSSYDPTTKTHTVTIERNKTFADRSFSSRVIYNYTYYTGPTATADFTKGVTDRIVISSNGAHEVNTPRISTDDSSSSNLIIKGIAAGGPPPTLNGEYRRSGTHALTKALDGKSITVNQTITFIACSIARNGDSTITLTGTAQGEYSAVGPSGGTASRHVLITFNGDGTATLSMTREPQGVTDTSVIDVKTGKWLKWAQ